MRDSSLSGSASPQSEFAIHPGSVASSGNETFRGTAGADTFRGGGGNDAILGLGGDDHLFAETAGTRSAEVTATMSWQAARAATCLYSIRTMMEKTGSTTFRASIISGSWWTKAMRAARANMPIFNSPFTALARLSPTVATTAAARSCLLELRWIRSTSRSSFSYNADGGGASGAAPDLSHSCPARATR